MSSGQRPAGAVGQIGLIPEGAAYVVSLEKKISLRFCLFAAGLWLSAASAFAQDARDITLKLNPAQVAEIARLIDLQPMSIAPPAAYWDLQTKILDTGVADPKALKAVLAAGSAAR